MDDAVWRAHGETFDAPVGFQRDVRHRRYNIATKVARPGGMTLNVRHKKRARDQAAVRKYRAFSKRLLGVFR